MTSHPDWVPDDIVNFYNRLEAREIVEGLPIDRWQTPESYYESERFRLGFATLAKLIESPIMEKAWKAIDKRRSDAPPERFCWLILALAYELEVFDAVRTSKFLESVTRLEDEIDSALRKFKKETEFSLSGEKVIRQVLHDAREIALNHEETWKSFDEYVGQRYAPNAKRIFLIRLFAEFFEHNYETPLYSTIANITAVLVDEDPLDPDHVRRTVKSHKRPIKTYFTPSDPDELGS